MDPSQRLVRIHNGARLPWECSNRHGGASAESPATCVLAVVQEIGSYAVTHQEEMQVQLGAMTRERDDALQKLEVIQAESLGVEEENARLRCTVS